MHDRNSEPPGLDGKAGDRLSHLALQEALARHLPSTPRPDPSHPQWEGYDKHGLQEGYLESVARAAARFNHPSAFGQQPAAGWRGAAVAQQEAEALGLVRKAKPAPSRPEKVDDPTGTARTLAALKQLIAGGSVGTGQPMQVRKAAKPTFIAVYEKGKLVGAIPEADLRKISKAGDVAFTDVDGAVIGYGRQSDVVPFKSAQPMQARSTRKTEPSRTVDPQWADWTPDDMHPVKKGAPRTNTAILLMMALGRSQVGISPGEMIRVTKAQQPATYDRLLEAGARFYGSLDARRRHNLDLLIGQTTPTDQAELARELVRIQSRIRVRKAKDGPPVVRFQPILPRR